MKGAKIGIGFPMRWQAAAVGVQVAAVAVCGVVGWQLIHPGAPGPALSVKHATGAPAVLPVVPALVPRLPVHAPGPAPRPGLEDLISRVNRDDARLYRGQWATLQLVASATRNYLTNHVVPLLLAAAKGGGR